MTGREEAVEGGEGGATQEEAAEGGAAVETALLPQDTEELLDAIATQDYGVSDDRSSKLTAPALRAYNQALKCYTTHKQHDVYVYVGLCVSVCRSVTPNSGVKSEKHFHLENLCLSVLCD